MLYLRLYPSFQMVANGHSHRIDLQVKRRKKIE